MKGEGVALQEREKNTIYNITVESGLRVLSRSKIRCSEIESEGIFHNMVPIANLYTC